jgi:hypothetical protein
MRGLLRLVTGPFQARTALADKTTSEFPASNDCEVTDRDPLAGRGEFVISRPPNRQKVKMSDGIDPSGPFQLFLLSS